MDLAQRMTNAVAYAMGQTKANDGPEAAVKFVGYIVAQLAGLTAHSYGIAAAERMLVAAHDCALASVEPESPGSVH